MEQEEPGTRMTFVLRLVRDEAGRVSGVLERVRTGEKTRFAGIDGVAAALIGMLQRERTDDHQPQDA